MLRCNIHALSILTARISASLAFAQNLMRIPVENRKLFCEPPPNCVNK